MRDEIKELSNWDFFFYYGENGLDDECEFDLYQILLEDKRSLYYNRRESAGISSYENNPNDINLQINARFDAANAVAYRNSVVTDGTGSTKDRRIAVSQHSINFEAVEGNLNINVLYFIYANYEQPKSNSFPLVR